VQELREIALELQSRMELADERFAAYVGISTASLEAFRLGRRELPHHAVVAILAASGEIRLPETLLFAFPTDVRRQIEQWLVRHYVVTGGRITAVAAEAITKRRDPPESQDQ
jgi:hypothetical protein